MIKQKKFKPPANFKVHFIVISVNSQSNLFYFNGYWLSNYALPLTKGSGTLIKVPLIKVNNGDGIFRFYTQSCFIFLFSADFLFSVLGWPRGVRVNRGGWQLSTRTASRAVRSGALEDSSSDLTSASRWQLSSGEFLINCLQIKAQWILFRFGSSKLSTPISHTHQDHPRKSKAWEKIETVIKPHSLWFILTCLCSYVPSAPVWWTMWLTDNRNT